MNDPSRTVTIRLTLPEHVVGKLREAAAFHHNDGLHDELVDALTKHLRDVAEDVHLERLRRANDLLPRRERINEHTLVALAALKVRRGRRAA